MFDQGSGSWSVVDDLRQAAEALRAEAGSAVTGLGSADDGFCRVVADAVGGLRDVSFGKDASNRPARVLTDHLWATYEQAVKAAQEGEPVDPEGAGLVVDDLGVSVWVQGLAAKAARVEEASRRLDAQGLDAVLGSSPFDGIDVGPGLEERVQAVFARLAAGVRSSEFADARGEFVSDDLTVEVDAPGRLLVLRMWPPALDHGLTELRLIVLRGYREAVAVAGLSAVRVLGGR